MDHRSEMIREGAASLPPAAVAAVTLAGVSLQDWVLMATLGWIAMQISYFLYQRWKEFKIGKNIEEAVDDLKAKYRKHKSDATD